MSDVSIIIPNYNKKIFLDDTLQSCLIQGLNIVKEIIIVDDNSTDDSWDILQRYQKQHPYLIKIYKNPKKGAASARNFGLSKANGKYIQWLDSDDILGKEKINIQLDFLKKNDRKLCHCRWVRFNGQIENLFGNYGPSKSIQKTMNPLDLLCTESNMVALHAWLGEKKLYEEAGGWDEDISYNDDGEFMYRVIASCEQIGYVDKAIVYYRSNLKNSLSNLDNDKIESYFKSIESFEKLVLNSMPNPSSAYLKAISNKYYEFIYLSYNYPSRFRKIAYKKIRKYGSPDISHHVNSSKFKLLYKLFGWKTVELLKAIRSSTLKSIFFNKTI